MKATPGGGADKLAVDRVATLCRIAHVERQDVGARVELVGEARLQLCDIVSTEPFVKGVFRQVSESPRPLGWCHERLGQAWLVLCRRPDVCGRELHTSAL